MRRAVEHAVQVKQSLYRIGAVRAVPEAVEHSFFAGRGDTEDHSATSDAGSCAFAARTAFFRGAVKHALDVGQIPERAGAVVRRTLETVCGFERAGPAQGEDGPASAGTCRTAAAPAGHAVQIAVYVDQPRSGNAPSDPPVKLYSTFSFPDVLTLKMVPHPTLPVLPQVEPPPPICVVP